jgi:glutaminase
MNPWQAPLEQIASDLQSLEERGQVAQYIPELACVSDRHYGLYLCDTSGNHVALGEAETLFSIQSISKVFALVKAYGILGDQLWERVGREPSGNPFNHLSLLEQEKGIPRNPLLNAGAIVVCDILLDILDDPLAEMLSFIKELGCNGPVEVNSKVAASEKRTGFNNYAATNLMKSFGNLNHSVEDVLDLYFHLCAIEMNCRQLAQTFYVFTNEGRCINNHPHLTVSQSKRLNAIMMMCGFYDEAGDFAYEVGLPGKSGVGGGIAAVLPGAYSIACWSPGLNKKGNSLLAMETLERFTTATGHSIF